MTQSFRPWLPDSFQVSSNIKPMIDQMVSDWSHRWFPEGVNFKVSDLSAGLHNKLGAKRPYYHIFGECFGISKSDKVDAHIAQELLGFEAKQVTISAGDQLALDELSKACIDDLKQDLCKLFDVDHRSGADNEPTSKPFDKNVWNCEISDTSDKIKFVLVFEKDTVTRLVKSRIPATSGNTPLTMRAETIGHATLKLGALVGTRKLTVAEMTHLEVGDVIELDQSLNDLVKMTVNGEVMQQSMGIEKSNDHLALRLKS